MAGPSALDLYLNRIRDVRALGAGTPETSYYPAVQQVFEAAGNALKPKVVCLHHPSSSVGIPDYGLFLAPQKRNAPPPEWRTDTPPERGAVEVKGTAHSIDTLVKSKQVQQKYLPHYQLVLVTNLWQFRLLRHGTGILETFDLAPNEAAFWSLVHGPRPKALQSRFADFLDRCLRTNAPLARPKDLAYFLASYARDALARLDEQATLPAVASLRAGLQSALGVAFDAKDGEHLFRSTLVQTLFYGVFSAWVAHSRANTAEPFAWRTADWHMTVPVTRFLFRQVASPDALEPLNLVPLLDAAADTLNRVDRTAFFANFADADAVQYFYEPFLEYFDPDLRKQLGVWYTPPEIVQYMVERVDRVLRSELNLPDGLADPNVWVLDPCCGTGSYLREVLNRIGRTLEEKGIGDLAAARLKEAATTRIIGFEIMTAPLVIAHWQVGETLRRAGAPLQQGERAAVYLTNALTGWDSAEEKGQIPGFDVLLAERTAANSVKQDCPILVVIGNPPYNAYAGTSQAGENDAEGNSLVAPYKEGLRERWGIRKYNLDDLFVRFFRIAERRIAERTGKGVVCYITNFAWLSGASFTVMRERLLHSFDRFWIDILNGDSRETGKVTPDGKPDPSVFSTPFNREGIRVGTAVATLVARDTGSRLAPRGFSKKYWGNKKRSDLLESLNDVENDTYEKNIPHYNNKYSLRTQNMTTAYESWPSIVDLPAVPPVSGLQEMRRGALLNVDLPKLKESIQSYTDASVTWQELQSRSAGPVLDAGRFDAQKAREALFKNATIEKFLFRRYALQPFDHYWCAWTSIRPVWNEPRPELSRHVDGVNPLFITRPFAERPNEEIPTFVTRSLPDYHLLRPNIVAIPFSIAPDGAGRGVDLLSGIGGGVWRPNISQKISIYLGYLFKGSIPADADKLIWYHALAISVSLAWRTDNADSVRQGWPRIPLPDSAGTLRGSATLGAQVAALLDPEAPVPGVTTGTILPELRLIAVPIRPQEGNADWSLSAWGNRSDRGVTMPGRGRVESRPYSPAEGATAAHASVLGATTNDIGLNAHTHWRNIPEKVWECRIGGYQVLKKWLSYRDASIIKRPLTPDEVAHIQNTARRLAAILLLGPELDASYRACAASHRPLT